MKKYLLNTIFVCCFFISFIARSSNFNNNMLDINILSKEAVESLLSEENFPIQVDILLKRGADCALVTILKDFELNNNDPKHLVSFFMAFYVFLDDLNKFYKSNDNSVVSNLFSSMSRLHNYNETIERVVNKKINLYREKIANINQKTLNNFFILEFMTTEYFINQIFIKIYLNALSKLNDNDNFIFSKYELIEMIADITWNTENLKKDQFALSLKNILESLFFNKFYNAKNAYSGKSLLIENN